MSRGPRTGREPKAPKGPKIDDREKYLADRERQRRALAMWARKVPSREIGVQLGCSAYTAHHLVRRALANTMAAPEAALRRRQMNEALEEEERIAWSIVARPGYKISPSGRVVFEPELVNGRAVPVVDQGVRIQALAHLLHIHDRQARLNGLDEPTKIDVAVGLEAAMAAVLLLEAEADREEAGVVDIPAASIQVALPPGRALG